MIRILIFSLVTILILSCSKKVAVDRVSFALDVFSEIELKDEFEVVLTESNNHGIEIEGDEDWIPYVSFKIEEGKLIIENTKNHKFINPKKNKIKLYINAINFRELRAAEGCKITSLTPITSSEFGVVLTGKANEANLVLDCDIFYCWNNFPTGGNIVLKGKANILKVWNTAIMTVDASELSTNIALIDNDSKGDVKVNVAEQLQYLITGEGNILVSGSLSLVVEKSPATGSGKLIIN